MSVKLMGIVFELNESITPLERLLLLALTDHADHDGDNVYPSVGLLCKKTGICERSVRDFLRSFRESGLLKVVKESTPTTPTRYSIDIEKLQCFRGACDAGGACGAPKPSEESLSKEEEKNKNCPKGTCNADVTESNASNLEAGSETPPNSAPPPSSRTPNSGLGGIEVATGGRSGRGGGKAFAESASFETLWAAYPSKTGKQAAFESWKKWSKQGDTEAVALAGIERYKKYVENRRATGFKELNYQNGSTFFYQRGWMSEWKIVEDVERKVQARQYRDPNMEDHQ